MIERVLIYKRILFNIYLFFMCVEYSVEVFVIVNELKGVFINGVLNF